MPFIRLIFVYEHPISLDEHPIFEHIISLDEHIIYVYEHIIQNLLLGSILVAYK